MDALPLTEPQLRFFEEFGFIKLPQALAQEIGEITREFEQVFVDRGVKHDGVKRSCIVPFADQREKLCALLDHPVVLGAARSLLGDDFNYLGSDGNYYAGDTNWHTDGFHTVGRYIKLAFYLDSVRKETGALRVVPGSHRIDTKWEGRHPAKSEELYGIKPSEYPAQVLDNDPGDVLIFNHNIMHAAFGGNSRRRMFTLNLSSRARNEEEIVDLEKFINGGARFWIDSCYSDLMKRTATPERQRHLEQVLKHEFALPGLAAKCRETMPEPARG